MQTISRIALMSLLVVPLAIATAAPMNTLTSEEQAGGWKLLFNGKTLEGWRGFKQKEAPTQGWIVQDGCLKKEANVRGGDIVTTEQFGDFELHWDWKLPPRANNGIKYFITEERDGAVGHEYQMIDDTSATPKHRTASFYDVLPPNDDLPVKPANEWNHSRVIVRGNHVEHWLNGKKVLNYELGSDAVLKAVAKSKFKDVPGFGKKMKGHILLTDHKDEAWFRNIKIRPLPEKQL